MFDEVFGGMNFGGLSDKEPRCPCGCTCICWEGEEERVSTTNSKANTVHASEFTTNPIPD